ncbi:DNA cytosine methyltransferase [Staphylococcus argensis]|uniref:Cytosine-specific methyltransferase n=1 Tax=Staphylococcus argensis TaxID=1607738 RepID=A0A2K4FAL2_9STAP|nr:DNA (cytosine-5-)-methyltransferase [Staphylococcus argensis]MCY6991376.1 DNA (cytosine-5-)-methyltransferase [Staphylococcus argensis]POA08389.1 DNA (cytosine-5-)-methyltransferase [Staphylococcus argensis]
MFTYIDLFSGAGGMTLGFELENFQQIMAVENEKFSAQTYKHNFPNHTLLLEDIKSIDEECIRDYTYNKNVDVIIGGPPCQGFSLAGKFGRKFLEDPRNQLFKEFLRFVNIIQPKIFIIENVARLLTHNKGKTMQNIINEIEKIGYFINYKIMQAADYNIPQKRQRIIIVGSKLPLFEFPKKSMNFETIQEAIDDLPPLLSGESSNIPNHFAMNHSNQMLEKMNYISDGGDRSQIPKDIRPKSGDARKYIRYHSASPSIPITGDMRKVFHYSQNRALTPRELARIQTFPDSFIFQGNSISIQQQIGNAVPPKLAQLLAIQVKKYLKIEKGVNYDNYLS